MTLKSAFNVSLPVQMFVLRPHIILSDRVYHAKFVADSDAEASMNSIVFQQRFYMYQLAVLCRDVLAEWSAGRRNLVEDPSSYLLNISIVVE
jgi:hypothetical protein